MLWLLACDPMGHWGSGLSKKRSGLDGPQAPGVRLTIASPERLWDWLTHSRRIAGGGGSVGRCPMKTSESKLPRSFQLFCRDHLEPLPERGEVGGDPSGRPVLPSTARSVAPVRNGGRTGSLLPPALSLIPESWASWGLAFSGAGAPTPLLK